MGNICTVTDNAGGIPEEIIHQVFEPYFTTKGPQHGTGVGLFMCKTIIEKNMNGTLDVGNVQGGAQFRIEMPEWVKEAELPHRRAVHATADDSVAILSIAAGSGSR